MRPDQWRPDAGPDSSESAGDTSPWKRDLGPDLVTYALGPIGADGTVHSVLEMQAPPPSAPTQVRGYSPEGKVLWQVSLPDLHASARTPVLRDDGVLLVGGVLDHTKPTENTVLIAIQTRSPGLARSGWPRGHHDNRNTCNAGTPLP